MSERFVPGQIVLFRNPFGEGSASEPYEALHNKHVVVISDNDGSRFATLYPSRRLVWIQDLESNNSTRHHNVFAYRLHPIHQVKVTMTRKKTRSD